MNLVLALVAAMIMWLWAPAQVGASEGYWLFNGPGSEVRIQGQRIASQPTDTGKRVLAIPKQDTGPARATPRKKAERERAVTSARIADPDRNRSERPSRQRRKQTQVNQGYRWTRYNRDKHGRRIPDKAIRNFSATPDQKDAMIDSYVSTREPKVVRITHLKEMQNKSGIKTDVTAAFPEGVEVYAREYPTDKGVALYEPFKVVDNGRETSGCWNWGWDFLAQEPQPEQEPGQGVSECITCQIPPVKEAPKTAEPVVWQGKAVPNAQECGIRMEAEANAYFQARKQIGEGGPDFFAGVDMRVFLKKFKTPAGIFRIGPAFSADWWRIRTKNATNTGFRLTPGAAANLYRMKSKYDKDFSVTGFVGYGFEKDETWTNDRKFHSVHKGEQLSPEFSGEYWFKDGVNNPYENPNEWPRFENIKLNGWLGGNIEMSYKDKTTYMGKPVKGYKPNSRTGFYGGLEWYNTNLAKINSMAGVFTQFDYSAGDKSVGGDIGVVLSRYDEIAKVKVGVGGRILSKNKDGNGASVLGGGDVDLGALAMLGMKKLEKWQRKQEEKGGQTVQSEPQPRTQSVLNSTNGEPKLTPYTGGQQAKPDADSKPSNGKPDYSLLRYNPVGDH